MLSTFLLEFTAAPLWLVSTVLLLGELGELGALGALGEAGVAVCGSKMALFLLVLAMTSRAILLAVYKHITFTAVLPGT